ncbi:signal recognition particle-docking protein FtsY [Candidatus Woesearchaeota archaeon]|nr:signal recognition particle-docking protein FtsY [Candidatus Woesearchaeota archaeon]
MFGFLKKKLKETVEKFYKEVDEETEEFTEEELKDEKIQEEIEKKDKEVKPKVKKPKAKKEKPKKEVVKEPELTETKEEEEIKGVKITYYVHGTTTDNEEHLATGHAPGELSELGKEQAENLKEFAKDKTFNVVFCSDLKRAIDSAELGFKDQYKIIQDVRLREADYGDLTQKPCSEFKQDMPKYVEKQFPNGESYIDVEIRIAEFLNHLYDKYYGQHIAIVAHQAPQLALDVLLKKRTWNQAIAEDWRLKKAWQPGWDYFIEEKVKVPEAPEYSEDIEEKEEPKEEKKGFLGKLFGKKKEEPKEEELPEEPVEEKEDSSIFGKLKDVVTKKAVSEEKFEELFFDLEVAMLENNVALEVIEKIKEDLKKELVDTKVLRGQIQEIIANTLSNSIAELFKVEPIDVIEKIKESKDPFVIAFIGINGSGKTTTIGKFAKLCQNNGLKPVMAAADTFRAAAIQQLEEHAKRLDVKMIKHDYGSDPAAVGFDAIKFAKAKGYDVVLIDTAGRLHSNANLMDEMKKIIRVCTPDMKLFIGESITGNDCVEQATKFNEAVGIDGIILSKVDVDDKGGAAISVSHVTGKPILYIGTGQDYEDMKKFDKNIILDNLGI